MYRALYIIFICLLLLPACGEEPKGFVPIMPDQKIRTFDYSIDAVWSSLITYLEKKDIDIIPDGESDRWIQSLIADLEKQDINIESIDKELGSIITDFIPIDPKSTLGKAVLFPEKGERIIEKAKYDMVIVVKKVDEKKTSVQIFVHLSKYSRSWWTYYSWRDQLSNGYIEKQLFEELEKALKEK